jgi:hypothetical protein
MNATYVQLLELIAAELVGNSRILYHVLMGYGICIKHKRESVMVAYPTFTCQVDDRDQLIIIVYRSELRPDGQTVCWYSLSRPDLVEVIKGHFEKWKETCI